MEWYYVVGLTLLVYWVLGTILALVTGEDNDVMIILAVGAVGLVISLILYLWRLTGWNRFAMATFTDKDGNETFECVTVRTYTNRKKYYSTFKNVTVRWREVYLPEYIRHKFYGIIRRK